MKTLHALRTKLQRLSEGKVLGPFHIVFETLEGIIFGTREVTAAAPHFLDHIEIKRYMGIVIFAMAPSALAAIYFFRLDAIKIIITSYVAGGIVEVLFAMIRKKEIEEGFLVTGLILPSLCLPLPLFGLLSLGLCSGSSLGKRCLEVQPEIFSIRPWWADCLSRLPFLRSCPLPGKRRLQMLLPLPLL